MPVTHQGTIRAVAALLLIAAVSQSIYTALYIAKLDVPRQLLWGSEGVLFAILAALAGAAMVKSRDLTLVFAAIAFSAALNVVQVGVGLTLFGPFGDAAKADPALAPLAGAIVDFSFFVYNAAKLLLGFAALVAGLSLIARGSKLLGGASALFGGAAMIANGGKIVAGGDLIAGVPLAGGTGVLATLLLAVALLGLAKDD
ncbi:MAG: thiamine biosynthesis protein ThiC [Porphyrobacter sp.]|nr:thiamine biosynthesis protein ThiC [Porphyrobacter sp.]